MWATWPLPSLHTMIVMVNCNRYLLLEQITQRCVLLPSLWICNRNPRRGARRYLASVFFFFSCSRMQIVNLKNRWSLTSYLPCCLRNSLLQLFLNINLLVFLPIWTPRGTWLLMVACQLFRQYLPFGRF